MDNSKTAKTSKSVHQSGYRDIDLPLVKKKGIPSVAAVRQHLSSVEINPNRKATKSVISPKGPSGYFVMDGLKKGMGAAGYLSVDGKKTIVVEEGYANIGGPPKSKQLSVAVEMEEEYCNIGGWEQDRKKSPGFHKSGIDPKYCPKLPAVGSVAPIVPTPSHRSPDEDKPKSTPSGENRRRKSKKSIPSRGSGGSRERYWKRRYHRRGASERRGWIARNRPLCITLVLIAVIGVIIIAIGTGLAAHYLTQPAAKQTSNDHQTGHQSPNQPSAVERSAKRIGLQSPINLTLHRRADIKRM